MTVDDGAERFAQAEQTVIGGLIRGDDVAGLVQAVAVIARRGDVALGESMIGLAADALSLGGFDAVRPLDYQGLREKYLPEVDFRGKVAHRNSQYALYGAAALRGGVRADVYADAGWWNAELWLYALYAAVIYVRASAERLGTTADQVARTLASTRGVSVST